MFAWFFTYHILTRQLLKDVRRLESETGGKSELADLLNLTSSLAVIRMIRNKDLPRHWYPPNVTLKFRLARLLLIAAPIVAVGSLVLLAIFVE